MEVQDALLSGASIGLTIAAPVGPMAIIVIRRTISNGFVVGCITGAGASTINLIYATLALCGIDRLAQQSHDHRTLMTAVTALILLFLALRMLRPRVSIQKTAIARHSLLGYYTSALAFNSVNPMGFALIVGAVTGVSGLASRNLSGTAALAGGVFAGSILWWIGLVAVTSTVGIRFSPRAIRLIDVTAGLALLALAISTVSKLV
jgi:putative LysE/RhtB family amino acid efflux pump